MLDLPSCLLVDPSVAHVQDVVLDAGTYTLVLTMEATPTTAACPVCGQLAHRIHSRYERTLADVTWALVPVQIHLHIRRFFCDQVACARRIFTERLPALVQPYARRTTRLARIQQRIGLLLGGAAGAVLCAALRIPAALTSCWPSSGATTSQIRRRHACLALMTGHYAKANAMAPSWLTMSGNRSSISCPTAPHRASAPGSGRIQVSKL